MKRWPSALLLALFVLLPACSSGKVKTYPVRGKVLYKGNPAVGALVLFHPAEDTTGTMNKPYATVKADGTFVLTTYSDDEDGGAPAGEYKVSITWAVAEKETTKSTKIDLSGGERAPGPPDKLGGKYDATKSTLKATVKPEANDLEPFKLD